MFSFVSVTETKYSIAKTAELLGVDYSTVSRLLSSGKLGHFRVGDRKVVGESHLEAYMKSIERLPRKNS
ncbi:MAG TPA: helix-turn-helix domain-containing protein [Pyrinomonadaceae bacterium]|jgi:DNA binding domain, excisionase family|nr:helix-turn-helix domain-containing protein [Pyrinomonadaceae bacterium]